MTQRVEKNLNWPILPGEVRAIDELVAELARGIDASAPEIGAALILVAAPPIGEEGVPRLAERLAGHWENQGMTCLIVDAHPAAPFTQGLFGGSPEGFTEILHYGLSPATAAKPREGVPGMWIAAGAPWTQPLESPVEPVRSIQRLMDQADRIVLLVDAQDAEGLLQKLREMAHFQLNLQPQLEESKVSGEQDPLASYYPDEEPEVFSLESEMTRRRRRIWIPLLIVLVAALAGSGWWLHQRGMLSLDRLPFRADRDQPGADKGFSALPEQAELPYHGGSDPRDGASAQAAGAESSAKSDLASGDGAQGESASRKPAAPTGVNKPKSPSLPSSRDAAAKEAAAKAGSAAAKKIAANGGYDAAKAKTPPAKAPVAKAAQGTNWALPPAGKTAASVPSPAGGPQRRFESRQAWRSALDHSGTFHVHVESYQDSLLGARTARDRGFTDPGFSLRPTQVRGVLWYRLCVGPFSSLASAAAYRDWLLSSGGEDYCVIGTD